MLKKLIHQGRAWGMAALLAVGCSGYAFAVDQVIPIHTKNTSLRLPITMDDRARSDLSEVKLYVRGPSGKWEVAKVAPPKQTAFDYTVPEDGEYWFTFVIVDKRGRMDPANVEITPPHRAVMVDSKAPDVGAQAIPFRGQRLLQCQVRDANPDWTTLRVVYEATDGTWQPLSVYASDTPTVFNVPNPAVLEGKIRVTIADRAGNRTTRDIDLGDPTARLGVGGKAAVDKGRPDPSLFPQDMDTPAKPNSLKGVQPVEHRTVPMPPKPLLPDVPVLPDVPADGIKLPTITPPLPPINDNPERTERPPVTKPPGKFPAIPDPILDPPMPIAPPTNMSTVRKPDLDRESSPPHPPKQDLAAVGSSSHKILDTTTCTIDYKLEGVVRVSSKIDFWATKDGGRTWLPLRDEANGLPPAKLALPGDGLYGIRIRLGGGSKPPEPGEEPDCEVEVDTTKPIVKLLSPTIGTGEDVGTVLLSWSATDRNLLSNSINLRYSTRPNGPWDEIVTGYKNEGVYRWALPTGLTGPIYVRMEATDRAGNVGQHTMNTPIELENGKQRVKVLGISGGK